MKTTLLSVFAASMCIGPTFAQRLLDIPVVTPDGYDIRDYDLVTRGGDGTLKSGEYVVWRHPFAWNAITANTGERIPLIKDKSTMIFESATADTITVTFPPRQATIRKPKNIDGVHLLFSFAEVSIHDASKDLILYRIGRPNQISQSQGENWFFYTKTVTRNRTRYLTETGTARGKIGSGMYERDINLQTENRIPVEETITYQPYSFKVHFNDEGFVSKIEDLTDRTINWTKR